MWELCYYCFNISCKRTKLRAKNKKKKSLIWQCISVNWHKVNGTSNSFSYSSYNVFCFCLYTELHICWCGWCGRTRGTTMSSTFFISALVCWEGNWESNLPLIWVTKSQWKLRLYRKHRNTQHCTAQGIKCLIPGNISGKFLEKKKKKKRRFSEFSAFSQYAESSLIDLVPKHICHINDTKQPWFFKKRPILYLPLREF